MSNNTATIPARREKCGIPRERASQAGIPRPHTWELHIGIIQLFIHSDSDEWLACSKADYSPGPTGTAQEHARARRAVEILNRDHRNSDAGIPEIRAALNQAAAQLFPRS